jgi:hypothetical protein
LPISILPIAPIATVYEPGSPNAKLLNKPILDFLNDTLVMGFYTKASARFFIYG